MDVLAALENLEDAEREKKYKGRGSTPQKKGKPSSGSSAKIQQDVAAANAAKNEKAGRLVDMDFLMYGSGSDTWT